MTTSVSNTATKTLTPMRTVGSGCGVLIGDVFGVAQALCLCGLPGQFRSTGAVEVRKAAGESWVQGQRVFWDEAAMQATTQSAGHVPIGEAAPADALQSVGVVTLVGG